MASASSFVVVGGGVIGLSVAWELANRGADVTVVEQGQIGSKASWAGAGIIAPANAKTATQPIDQLLGLGSELHEVWHQRLKADTGVDNGYRNCGGLYAAFTAGDRAALAGQTFNFQDYEIEFEYVPRDHPAARPLSVNDDWKLVWAPGESQIRNPDHLAALAIACKLSSVQILENCGNVRLERQTDDKIVVCLNGQKLAADHVCICAGAWSTPLLGAVGVRLPMIPVRGQMLLFKLEQPLLKSIINVGCRYIVPRDDGYVLVGSTMEEVGFDESNTDEKIAELQDFATSMVSQLTPDKRVKQWSGLRPATNDGFPFIGRLNRLENVSVATGHFRSGLQMAPATAVILADLIVRQQSIMDGTPFAPSRLDFTDSIATPLQVQRGGF